VIANPGLYTCYKEVFVAVAAGIEVTVLPATGVAMSVLFSTTGESMIVSSAGFDSSIPESDVLSPPVLLVLFILLLV